jgi:hypothetical protein
MTLRFGNQDYESVLVKDHAAMRMLYRNISQKELSELLVAGEVVEDYPNDFPFPSKLIFKLVNNRPLHAVVAMDIIGVEGRKFSAPS